MKKPGSQRIVVAVGGNALLRRGETASIHTQRRNARVAAQALAPVIEQFEVVITHGNGPQIGMLALQQEETAPHLRAPLDVLGAESEGLIGYLLELELRRVLPTRKIASLLTMVEIDPGDPTLGRADKPIGPVYDSGTWREIAKAKGWTGVADGSGYRRVVPSPAPVGILQKDVIAELVDRGVTTICAGGGGIPVCADGTGGFAGVEAVVDKDWTSARLAAELQAEMLVMLTDVEAVYRDWGHPEAAPIGRLTSDETAALKLPVGSMGPKVDAALWFVKSGGRSAAIGALASALKVVQGRAGTRFE